MERKSSLGGKEDHKRSEKCTVINTLRKVPGIEVLPDDQFTDLSNANLAAWEGGRLRDLIEDVSKIDDLDESGLLTLLAEAQVLSALHMAEAAKAKLDIIKGLSRRIANRALENTVRDYIANHPWLLSPLWETFKVETSVNHVLDEAASSARLGAYDDQDKRRINLALSSGSQLLVVEFMRPGLSVDREHLYRYQTYVDIIATKIEANSAYGFETVSGLLVADKLNRRPDMLRSLARLRKDQIEAIEWDGLLGRAQAQWQEFLDVLVKRAPDDDRLADLRPA